MRSDRLFIADGFEGEMDYNDRYRRVVLENSREKPGQQITLSVLCSGFRQF